MRLNEKWEIAEVIDAKLYNKMTGELIGEWPAIVENLNKQLKETGEYGWSLKASLPKKI